MSSEALRLAGELPSIDNLKKIAASDSPKAIQNALNNAIKWIQSLERELKFERAASFRDQVASLEAERDQLRAEVERLRPNALRYEWLRDDINSDWAICEWSHDEPDGIGYYRDARAPDVVDAAIDRAIEAAKEATP